MSTTFIIDMKTDPELKALRDDLKDLETQSREQMEFIKKQVEDLGDKCMRQRDEIWARIKSTLVEKNLLPSEYTEGSHCLSTHPEGYQLFMESTQELPFNLESLKKLLH